MNRVLNVLSRAFSGGIERRLACESCGREFTCGASLKGCWCSEIKLSEVARAELRTKYSDCLCRDCLETTVKTTERSS